MAIKYSNAVKDAQLDALETAIGASAVLKLWATAASPPANITDADPVTPVVAVMNLDSDWMAAASGGSKDKAGTWEDTSADNAGLVDFFRIYANDGTTQHIQGSVTIDGGGGDMELDNNDVEAGQSITITQFTITAGN